MTKISEHYSASIRLIRLSVCHVTFLSPLKLTVYHLVFIVCLPVTFRSVSVLIFSHTVTRKPNNLRYPSVGGTIRNCRKCRKELDLPNGLVSFLLELASCIYPQDYHGLARVRSRIHPLLQIHARRGSIQS